MALNGDHIKPGAALHGPVFFKIFQGGHGDFALFGGRHRPFGVAEALGPARFDLYKNKNPLVFGDDIDLRLTGAIIARNDMISLPLQVIGGQILAAAADALFKVRHVRRSPQARARGI